MKEAYCVSILFYCYFSCGVRPSPLGRYTNPGWSFWWDENWQGKHSANLTWTEPRILRAWVLALPLSFLSCMKSQRTQ